MHRFSRAELAATPWKNGGGVTREIVSSPPGAGLGSFAWRVSIADVASDGPFSVFEGVDRVLVLLEGNGVELRGAEGAIVHRLDRPFAPFTFSGDDRISSSLLAGPSTDFNVMTRRGTARADVRVLRTAEQLPASRAGVLFAARGRWTARAVSGVESQLEPGDGCWWDGETAAWRVAPAMADAVLLVVRIDN